MSETERRCGNCAYWGTERPATTRPCFAPVPAWIFLRSKDCRTEADFGTTCHAYKPSQPGTYIKELEA